MMSLPNTTPNHWHHILHDWKPMPLNPCVSHTAKDQSPPEQPWNRVVKRPAAEGMIKAAYLSATHLLIKHVSEQFQKYHADLKQCPNCKRYTLYLFEDGRCAYCTEHQFTQKRPQPLSNHRFNPPLLTRTWHGMLWLHDRWFEPHRTGGTASEHTCTKGIRANAYGSTATLFIELLTLKTSQPQPMEAPNV